LNKPDTASRSLKNLLIEPNFQLKLIGYFIFVFALTTISLYSTTFLFFWKLKQKAMNVGIPDGHIFYRYLANQKSDLDGLFIGLAILNFLVLIGIGFLISHRVAGPINKLKNYLKNMAKDSEDFKLRENDFFHDLQPIVKDLKDRLK
jgi:hypothetical protein